MYKKRYLINYEQTGGDFFGRLIIITQDGRIIKGVLTNGDLERLNTPNAITTIYFEANGKTYKITKPDKYYQIISDDDIKLLPTNYNFNLTKYQTLAININGTYYKTMWIKLDDYQKILSLRELDVIIDPLFDFEQTIKISIEHISTEPKKIIFKIIKSDFITDTHIHNYTFIINK
jgi:hypothetical protein